MTDQDVCQYIYMAIYMDLMSITAGISGRLAFCAPLYALVSPFQRLSVQRCYTTEKHKVRNKVDQKRPDKATCIDHALRH